MRMMVVQGEDGGRAEMRMRIARACDWSGSG
jgi:hypothetical protein